MYASTIAPLSSTLRLDPYGMLLVERNYSITSENYRFGFNGYENTDELLGDNIAIDFGARVFDSRVARFFSIDPRSGEYPWQSVYVYYSNCPIAIVDVDGMGGLDDDPPTGNEAGAPVRTDFSNTSNYYPNENWVENDLVKTDLIWVHSRDPDQRDVIYWDPNSAMNGVHKDPVTGEIVGNGAYRAVREINRTENVEVITPAVYSDPIIVHSTLSWTEISRNPLPFNRIGGSFGAAPPNDPAHALSMVYCQELTGVDKLNPPFTEGINIVFNIHILTTASVIQYTQLINNFKAAGIKSVYRVWENQSWVRTPTDPMNSYYIFYTGTITRNKQEGLPGYIIPSRMITPEIRTVIGAPASWHERKPY